MLIQCPACEVNLEFDALLNWAYVRTAIMLHLQACTRVRCVPEQRSCGDAIRDFSVAATDRPTKAALMDGSLRKLLTMNVHRTVGALLTSVLLMALPLSAASASARMPVSVQVVARAIVTVDDEPVIEVTTNNIARGYVDLDPPILLHGRTNSRRGYMLQVAKTSEEFSTINLSLPNATMTVAGHETWIQRPYVPGGEVIPVTGRLFLAPGATAGRHVLPISFNGSPL